MKLTFKILILFVAVSLVSCFEDPGTDIVWGDKAYLELDRAGQPNPTVSKQYNRLNDGTTYPLDIQVNLMGRPQSKDVTVNFEIEAGSTAIDGFHYTKDTPGTSIVIPAGQNVVNIEFTVLADNINPGETLSIIVNLTGGDLPLSKYVRATFNLRTLCPFNRANFVGAYDALEPGYGTYTVNFTADGVDPNAVVADNFWDFGGVVKYVFNPATNAVTLPSQDVTMGGTVFVVSGNGPATYDACTYSFIVPYKVVRKSDGATFDTNTHTFTKQ